MIKVNQMKLRPGYDNQDVFAKLVKTLRCSKDEIKSFQILKESIDARKKPDIMMSLSVAVSLSNEEKFLKKNKNPDVILYQPVTYHFPEAGSKELEQRPVIIGSGPAGLFCAYYLSLYGYQPILLERGKCVEDRTKDVQDFWKTGKLKTESNVQFGEGGAGTFSDGKLNTLVNDKDGRNTEVLRVFVKHGASERILYDAKPHIGTDVLVNVVSSMREIIIKNGGEVRFESKVTELLIDDNKVTGVIINGTETLYTNQVVLAIGHSARDTFAMLHKNKIPMDAKAFAVGFRVMHPQGMINTSQYGIADYKGLPPSPYKVTAKGNNGRGVYSFCMCPGGYVVNASSEEQRLAVNGMSYSNRGGAYANSAIIVSVDPLDFGFDGPLAGIAFQRKIEEAAYLAGKGKIPVEYYEDFKNAKKTGCKEVIFSGDIPLKGEYLTSDLTTILPQELNEAFVDGMEAFEKKIRGFASSEAIMAGVESRTSSPVRIHRDETGQSEVRGLYPCGEGAGYAGGITSAAMDGIRIAEAIRREFQPFGSCD